MLMPLGDDDSGLRIVPVVTIALIILNVIIFVVELMQSDIQNFFMKWAVVPLEYAQFQDLSPTIPFPFWVTLLTSMFLHGGLMHVGGNMLYLWIFGDNVEGAMGPGRFVVFYLICGLMASLAHIVLNTGSEIPSLGASGAISGVLGAYIVLFPHQKVRVLVGRQVTQMPALIVIGLWIILQFISGVGQLAQTEQTGGVAYAAHVGGFLAGLGLVWVFRSRS